MLLMSVYHAMQEYTDLTNPESTEADKQLYSHLKPNSSFLRLAESHLTLCVCGCCVFLMLYVHI